jgi:hypothetical protein
MSHHYNQLPVRSWFAAALAVTFLSGAGVAEVESLPDSLQAVVSESAPAEEVSAGSPATPVEVEFEGIRETYRRNLVEATARYGAAGDAAAALAAQRGIAALKHGLERDLLELQLRLARQRADAEAIAELEQAQTAVEQRLTNLDLEPTPAQQPGSAAR